MSDKATLASMATIDISKASNLPEFIEIYSNAVRVNLTAVDISVIFGKMVQHGGASGEVGNLVEVRMSPQQFKLLSNSLPPILQEWEKRFGAISTPPGSGPSQDGMRQAIEKAEQNMKVSDAKKLQEGLAGKK